MRIYRFFLVCLILPLFLAASYNNEKKGKNMEKSADTQSNKMEKFNFLLGEWQMQCKVPKSVFHEGDTGSGTGTFKRTLDDKYVCFDYVVSSSSKPEEIGKAHAIFAWDEKAKIYRYWWFENSGSFTEAACNFINDETLFLNWHDSLFIQTFRKSGPNEVVLKMEHPNSEGKYEVVLEVIFTKK
jgi:hypothetical protein